MVSKQKQLEDNDYYADGDEPTPSDLLGAEDCIGPMQVVTYIMAEYDVPETYAFLLVAGRIDIVDRCVKLQSKVFYAGDLIAVFG